MGLPAAGVLGVKLAKKNEPLDVDQRQRPPGQAGYLEES
jgi:hypothetical protein